MQFLGPKQALMPMVLLDKAKDNKMVKVIKQVKKSKLGKLQKMLKLKQAKQQLKGNNKLSI